MAITLIQPGILTHVRHPDIPTIEKLRNDLRITQDRDDAWITERFKGAWVACEQYATHVFGSHTLEVFFETDSTGQIPLKVGQWNPPITAVTILERLESDIFSVYQLPAHNGLYYLAAPNTQFHGTFTLGDENVEAEYLEPMREAATRVVAYQYDNRGSVQEGRANSAGALLRSGAAELLLRWKTRSC